MPSTRKKARLALVVGRSAASEVTTGEYLSDWLAGKQSLRESTAVAYEIHVRRYLSPYLGTLPLPDLRPLDIERMYREITTLGDDRSHPLSISTLRRIHATLMSAMNTAVRRGLIDRNPAATVELPPLHTARVRTWSADDLRRFLTDIQHDRLHLLYVLLGLAGLRRGEVVALRWCDIDVNQGMLHIEQSAVRVGGTTVIGPPKSAAGRRVVAIDDDTARRLHWHGCKQRLEIRSSLGTAPPELVFTTPSGETLDPAYVSRRFDRLVAQHGLPRIRLHDLRHTSASIGLASGESLLEVSRRLGHSSISVTADIYSHVSPLVAKESAERLAKHVLRP